MPHAQNRTLRTIVFSILEQSSISDPRDIAAVVLAFATDAEREAFLADAIATQVRMIIQDHRKAPLASTPARSAKVAAIRNTWKDTLNGRYCVGGTWKPLAEFTADDADAAALERKVEAVQLMGWHARFKVLASAIRHSGVETAGQLPIAPVGWPR